MKQALEVDRDEDNLGVRPKHNPNTPDTTTNLTELLVPTAYKIHLE